MGLLSNVLGFSAFGLAARLGQLGIQKRNPLENLGGHVIAMGVFGYAGYWVHHWDLRAAELIAEKRAQITARREGAESY
ncbi:protein related to NADH:ubiquinone oxidoreductase 14 kda [Pyrrhoderma noxium]|uniref:Protein related to NADH:ubiquinone oxidoreductase 14 kDa n=1 Tax=Pyrrhoderma noxium TaxID=2282107 RepID=A0A286U9I7_9AGAM|nr:protein related to NADH:ubiquinone oxidoreductase 14 kda [Pyrrhoderma noxium]